MREMIGSHTLAVVADRGYPGEVRGVGRVCNGESCLGNDIRKGFLRGVTIELPNEGVGDIDGDAQWQHHVQRPWGGQGSMSHLSQ